MLKTNNGSDDEWVELPLELWGEGSLVGGLE